MSTDDFYRTLPRRRMGAGVLIVNATGEILLVEPTYKPVWEIPGGVVEAGEAPRACVVREVYEELGIRVEPGRLLVIDHHNDPAPRGDSIMMVYDGGTLDSLDGHSLPPDELASARFVPASGLDSLMIDRMAFRLRQALRARVEGRTIEITNGLPYPLESAF